MKKIHIIKSFDIEKSIYCTHGYSEDGVEQDLLEYLRNLHKDLIWISEEVYPIDTLGGVRNLIL